MSRFILTCFLLCLAATASARMYQWVDPENGRTQLSGKPPIWYRSLDGGPRVFVFDNGKIVDDTHRSVTEAERERLRQQALVKAMEDKAAAREQLLEAKRLQAMLRDDEEQAPLELVLDEVPDDEIDPQPVADEVEEDETIEQMRALIQEWEQRRTQSARDLVDPR